MGTQHDLLPDDAETQIVTFDELIARGADPDAVARLPVRHRTGAGEPYWSLREAHDLLEMAELERSGP